MSMKHLKYAEFEHKFVLSWAWINVKFICIFIKIWKLIIFDNTIFTLNIWTQYAASDQWLHCLPLIQGPVVQS